MSKHLFVVRPSEAKLGTCAKVLEQKTNIFKLGSTVENKLNKDYGTSNGGQIYLFTSNRSANHKALIAAIQKRLRESEFNQISLTTGATDLKSGYFTGKVTNAVDIIKRYILEKEPELTFDARYDLSTPVQIEGKVDVKADVKADVKVVEIKADIKSVPIPESKDDIKYIIDRIVAVEAENKALKENAIKFRGVFATILGKIAELETTVKNMNEAIDEIKDGQTVASDAEETEENDEEVEDD